MAFSRFIYFCAVIGGWCAFVGWLISELVPLPASKRNTTLHVVVVAALVGMSIGVGLNTLSGTARGRWRKRLLPGLVGGLIAGAIGGLMGDVLYSSLKMPRWIGWTIMGLCIGSIEGVYERSRRKLRNGLIGGGLGGLIGGLLFDPMSSAVASGAGYASRATAFVILGVAIGCLIGLVQVVLREAWLTVLDGYRPGRQTILSQTESILGRGEWVTLPFMGSFGTDLEMEHLRIVRHADGRYYAEDKNVKEPTMVNQDRIQGRCFLNDGDVIRIGNNKVRFNEKVKHEVEELPEDNPRPAVPSPVAATVLPLPSAAAPQPTSPPKPVAQPALIARPPAPPKAVPIARPATPTPTAPPAMAGRCPECDGEVTGKPGMRICKHCGAMS